MAAQNFKEEDWGNGDTKLGQNWHKNFQAWDHLFIMEILFVPKIPKFVQFLPSLNGKKKRSEVKTFRTQS